MSGIGKTTLLKTIAGLSKPISGTISISGKSETYPKKIFSQNSLKSYFQPIRKRGFLGYIPQNLGLVRHATVMHNVMLGANAGHNKLWPKFSAFTLLFCLLFAFSIIVHSFLTWNSALLYWIPPLTVLITFILIFFLSFFSPHQAPALTAIDSLGISDYKYQIIRKLSGGQKRRVATARTLAQNPKLILADEFLTELDDKTKNIVKSEVLSYISQNNASIIIVEHDINRAREMSDRIFQISDGKLVELEG